MERFDRACIASSTSASDAAPFRAVCRVSSEAGMPAEVPRACKMPMDLASRTCNSLAPRMIADPLG